MENVLIDGHWRPSKACGEFFSVDPSRKQQLSPPLPVSGWEDCEAALHAAVQAAHAMREYKPAQLADFLDKFAAAIDEDAEKLVDLAHQETGLAKKPRLADVELPRTTNQLRQAAAAARDGSWALPTIDTKTNIRSIHGPIGPVAVFGPNNFPYAYNSVAGGDFAAAIAAGNPVIGKANSSHPLTTKRFAELAKIALDQCGLHPAVVQLIYRTSHEDGERLVSDPRLAAIGYTGSRDAGLKLKAAADKAGKPAYLELSSINPVVILPSALDERCDDVVNEFCTSCLMAAGQMCTNPGLLLLLAGPSTETFVSKVVEKFSQAPPQTLLSDRVAASLAQGSAFLAAGGAQLLTGGKAVDGPGYAFQNTLFRADGVSFLKNPHDLQCELFGPSSLLVTAASVDELVAIVDTLEGSLTGSIYTSKQAPEEAWYSRLAGHLRPRVGRLLNDKMPTGVAVSSAMNHGGPYPATGHAGFTAVGFPATTRRFSMLMCYDNVRHDRLPEPLQNANPARTWRWVDGSWTQADIPS